MTTNGIDLASGCFLKTEEWSAALQRSHATLTGKNKSGVRLPATNTKKNVDCFKVEGTQDHVVITMFEPAVTANMQTSAAAFEAWALALKSWCHVKNIEL